MTTLGIKQNKTGSNLFTDHSSNWVTHLKTPPCTPWSFFFFQNPASQVIIKYQFLNLLFFYLSTYTVQQHNPTTNLSNIPIVFPYFIFPLYPSNFSLFTSDMKKHCYSAPYLLSLIFICFYLEALTRHTCTLIYTSASTHRLSSYIICIVKFWRFHIRSS